jgi:hypothetical protein
MSSVNAHLTRILDRVTHIIADEVLNCSSLTSTYPGIGEACIPSVPKRGGTRLSPRCG